MPEEKQDRWRGPGQSIFDKPERVYTSFYITRAIAQFTARALGRVEVLGKENIPKNGPIILASNHRSMVDPPYMTFALDRMPYYMGKDELYHNKLIGTYFMSLGSFPVKRGAPDRAALRFAIDLLKNGRILGIFPEGTREVDNKLIPAEKGFAMIAKQTNAPIVPVALEGTEKVFPKGAKALRRGDVSINIGKPVTAQEILASRGVSGKESLEVIGEEVMSRIAALMRK
jgi:1-acyl-sn-glycerol-3-phosphate acyltransferase